MSDDEGAPPQRQFRRMSDTTRSVDLWAFYLNNLATIVMAPLVGTLIIGAVMMRAELSSLEGGLAQRDISAQALSSRVGDLDHSVRDNTAATSGLDAAIRGLADEIRRVGDEHGRRIEALEKSAVRR